MTHNISGDDSTYPSQFAITDDGDARDAASVDTALSALANRTEFLRTRRGLKFDGVVTAIGVANLVTVPARAVGMACFGWAGGGGGGGAAGSSTVTDKYSFSGSGGGGARAEWKYFPVTAGHQLQINIGDGGPGGNGGVAGSSGNDGNEGNPCSIVDNTAAGAELARWNPGGGGLRGLFDGTTTLGVKQVIPGGTSMYPTSRTIVHDTTVFPIYDVSQIPIRRDAGDGGCGTIKVRTNLPAFVNAGLPAACGPITITNGSQPGADGADDSNLRGGAGGGGGGGGPEGTGAQGGDGSDGVNGGSAGVGGPGHDGGANTGEGGGGGGSPGHGTISGNNGGPGGKGGGGKIYYFWVYA